MTSKRKKAAKNNWSVLTCQSNESDEKEKSKAFETIKTLSKSSRTALFNLGWMYEHGICTQENQQLALQTYFKSAEKKSPHALYHLSQLYTKGNLVDQNTEVAKDYQQQSLDTSQKIKFHNMMTTFLDLPYIENYQLVEDYPLNH